MQPNRARPRATYTAPGAMAARATPAPGIRPAAAPPAHVVGKHADRRPGGDEVDDCVPEALQWQHEGGHVFEREGGLAGVDDGVDAVGAGGDPGDEHGGEEEDGAFGVGPGCVVGLVGGAAAEGVVGPAAGAGGGCGGGFEFGAVGGGGGEGGGAAQGVGGCGVGGGGFGGCGGVEGPVGAVGGEVVVPVGGDGDGVSGALGFLGRLDLGAAAPAEGGQVDAAAAGAVDDFAGYVDLGGLGGAEGVVGVAEEVGLVVAGAKLFELLVLLVDVAAGADVDEEGDENEDPGSVLVS